MHALKLKAKQLVCMLLLAVICIGTMMPVLPANAAILTVTSWYIQMSIDDQSWALVGGVVTDEVDRAIGGGTPKEGMRLTSDMISLIRDGNGISVIESFDPEEDYVDDNEVNEDLVLTYPESFGLFSGNPPTEERTQAQLVLDSLLYDINGAFSLCYDTSEIADISDYQSKMVDLLNAASAAAGGSTTTLGGCSFRPATSSDISELATEYQSLSDYFVIEDASGRSQVFCYSMHKYPDGSGLNITWDMLTAEAFINYACGVSASGVYASDPGLLEGYVVGLFNSLVDFLSGALGLWTMDELIYNAGLRGGNSYAYGVFPTAWQSTIWTFFFICEIIAIAMLLTAIINNVLKKAASTVNPVVRANAMNQLLDIIKIVVLLVMLPLLLQIGLSLSASLSSMFSGALGDQTASQRFSVLMYGSSTIGGVVMSILYLGAMIYFNAYYFLRSVIVAFLVIVAPIAVAMIGISEEKKSYYKKWQNAIIGYVAIQPIHALILTILVIMPSTGRNIENIVAVYAMIPLGKMAKKIFLPDDQPDMASQLGDSAQSKAGDVAKAGAVGAVGAVSGAIAARANSKTAQMQAEDRWRDEHQDWNNYNRDDGNDSGAGSTRGMKDPGQTEQQGNKDPGQKPADKESKKEEMKAMIRDGGGDVETSTKDEHGSQQTSDSPGAEVVSNQGNTETAKEDISEKKSGTTDQDAKTTHTEQKGEAGEQGDTHVEGGTAPSGESPSNAQNESQPDSLGSAPDGDTSGQAQGGGDIKPADVEPTLTKSEGSETAASLADGGTDEYAEAYDRQEAIGDNWKGFKEDAKNDFENPYSSLYRQAQAQAKQGDPSMRDHIDSINKQKRDATKNQLKGMAMSTVGNALYLASGRMLGRDLIQAGMNRSQYAAARKAALNTQMLDSRYDRMKASAGTEQASGGPPLKRKNMAEFASKASASPSGGQNLTMTPDDIYDFGMDDVTIDRQGNMEYTTNENTDQETRQNLSDMADVFENGSEEDIEALRYNGYEMVAPVYSHGQPTGEFTVQTNENYSAAHGNVKYSSGGGGKVNVRGYQDGVASVKSVADCKDRYQHNVQDTEYENQMAALSVEYKGVNNIPKEKMPSIPTGYKERNNIKESSQIQYTAIQNAQSRGVQVNTSKASNHAASRVSAKKAESAKVETPKTDDLGAGTPKADKPRTDKSSVKTDDLNAEVNPAALEQESKKASSFPEDFSSDYITG